MSRIRPLSFHPLHSAHLPELADLWVASWNKAMPSIDFETRRIWFCDYLEAQRVKGVQTLCAFAWNGDMAGFVLIDPATRYLDQFVIAPKLWGRNIGHELMARAKDISPGGIRLDVNQDNPRAVKFYEKCGFTIRSEGVNPNSGLKTFALEWKPDA